MKTTPRRPRLEIFPGASNALWYWRLRAANGEVVADGAEGYAKKANARRAARRAVRIMVDAAGAATVEVVS